MSRDNNFPQDQRPEQGQQAEGDVPLNEQRRFLLQFEAALDLGNLPQAGQLNPEDAELNNNFRGLQINPADPADPERVEAERIAQARVVPARGYQMPAYIANQEGIYLAAKQQVRTERARERERERARERARVRHGNNMNLNARPRAQNAARRNLLNELLAQ